MRIIDTVVKVRPLAELLECGLLLALGGGVGGMVSEEKVQVVLGLARGAPGLSSVAWREEEARLLRRDRGGGVGAEWSALRTDTRDWDLRTDISTWISLLRVSAILIIV